MRYELRFLRHLPRVNIGVQQVVRALGQRLAQILRVQRLHIGVFVGEAQRRIVIEAPEDVSPLLRAFLAVVNGLSSAAQPPGQAIISTKSYSACPDASASRSLLVFLRPLATAVRTVPAPGMSKLASFQPCMPRTAVNASGSGFLPVTR